MIARILLGLYLLAAPAALLALALYAPHVLETLAALVTVVAVCTRPRRGRRFRTETEWLDFESRDE